MRRTQWSALRRLTAFLLALGFGLFTAEQAIADMHDGDAAAELVVHVGSHAQASGAFGDLRGHTPEDFSGHSVHVCHCVHIHGGLPASAYLAQNEPAPTTATIMAGVQAPAGADLELRLRPPIA